jgi:hypothetical protein
MAESTMGVGIIGVSPVRGYSGTARAEQMVIQPDIDLVAVTVRVPQHRRSAISGECVVFVYEAPVL